MRKLRLGLPKGSLEKATVDLFRKAGYTIVIGERSYFPSIDDDEVDVLLYRPQEMSRYVEDGVLDAAITGRDWVIENNSKVVEVMELAYAKKSLGSVKWVLATSLDSKIRSVKDLEGKTVATELVNVTKQYLKKNKVKAKVEFSWGATEVKPPRLADAIVDVTETGSSLAVNRLVAIDTVIESVTLLIANAGAWRDKWKRAKLENIALLLKGAISAEAKVGLKMNVAKDDLNQVLRILPALKMPTISGLSQKGWFAVETVIDESVVRTIIPKLKKAGASGIIEYSLNKVIY